MLFMMRSGVIVARCEIFHANYDKMKIPEVVLISMSRNRKQKLKTNTAASQMYTTEFRNPVCLPQARQYSGKQEYKPLSGLEVNGRQCDPAA